MELRLRHTTMEEHGESNQSRINNRSDRKSRTKMVPWRLQGLASHFALAIKKARATLRTGTPYARRIATRRINVQYASCQDSGSQISSAMRWKAGATQGESVLQRQWQRQRQMQRQRQALVTEDVSATAGYSASNESNCGACAGACHSWGRWCPFAPPIMFDIHAKLNRGGCIVIPFACLLPRAALPVAAARWGCPQTAWLRSWLIERSLERIATLCPWRADRGSRWFAGSVACAFRRNAARPGFLIRGTSLGSWTWLLEGSLNVARPFDDLRSLSHDPHAAYKMETIPLISCMPVAILTQASLASSFARALSLPRNKLLPRPYATLRSSRNRSENAAERIVLRCNLSGALLPLR